jgi:tRNA-binding protein
MAASGRWLPGFPPLATARRPAIMPPNDEGAGTMSTDSANAATAAAPATIGEFDRVDIRVGTIIDVQPFPEARKPAFKLTIDFGPDIGIKRSSAQITVHYALDQLIGRQVMAVVNFAPRQIGPFVSEVLTLGVPDDSGAVVLLRPDFRVANGGRMF